MCGICGIVNNDMPLDVELLKSMNSLIAHRGPDEEGYHIGSNIGLGHRRLSIIDLTSGQQPIYNERGNLCIIFNGEIYNYRELRKDLVKKGHKFTTKSDTEVILHLYEEKKTDCLNDLRGMFAIAIWDDDEKELFLARDRVGKKPLYFALLSDGIVFASEMKSLLICPGVKREIDIDALHYYLSFMYVPAPKTIFRGISKLEAGHFLLWKNGKSSTYRYWDISYQPKLQISEEEAVEGIISLLDESVKIRLESEVPLGCLLSGGVDSASVLAFMRRHVSGDLHTFSIGFEEEEYNELPLARLTAKRFETIHEELTIKPSAIDILPELVWHFDEPYADSSAIPTYYVSKMARSKVTVVLNGDGGDESFFGYERYLPPSELDTMHKWRKIPWLIRRNVVQPIASGLFYLYPLSVFAHRLYFGNTFSMMGPQEAYVCDMTLFKQRMRRLLLGSAIPSKLRVRDTFSPLYQYMNDGTGLSFEENMIKADVFTYLPGDLLVKMDRMAMAHSLEARSPFLDHRLMEFAAMLPVEIKFKEFQLKYILRKSLKGIIPDKILYGKKRGFRVPIDRWLREDIKQFTEDILLSPETRQRGFFDQRYVSFLLKEHQLGRNSYQHQLWALLNFEIWCRTFLDRADISSGPISL